jgi:hypothetical protein
MNPEQPVRRYEHNYFRGYVVAPKRAGKRSWTKYFSDKPDGRAVAKRRACEYSAWLLPRLPPPTKVKRTYVKNKTGVIGVSLVVERSRAGTLVRRYAATWPVRDGERKSGRATFSLALYGACEAFQRAVEARERGLRAFLRRASKK